MFNEKIRDKRTAICLSSGFFGFYAHCGFMKAIDELNISPVALSGCSAGALVGALWASGLSHEKIEEEVLAVRLGDLVEPPSLKTLLRGPFGFLTGNRFESLLERVLPVRTFEECEIPCAVTTFDLEKAELKSIHSGHMARAVRASASLPGMFKPTLIDDNLCWDGAVAEKVPLDSLFDLAEIDAVIVCYLARPNHNGAPNSIVGGMKTALNTMIYEIDQRNLDEIRAKGVDVYVVAPEVPRCGPHKLSQGKNIVEIARQETHRILSTGDFGCKEYQ